MDYKVCQIALSSIDEADGRYRISTSSAVADLIASIHEIGLIHPPILHASGERYTVISGFRRIAACRSAGRGQVAARILDTDTPDIERAMIAVGDNTLQRPLNIIEQARAYNLLTTVVREPKKQDAVFHALGLPQNRSYIKKILRINHLSPFMQDLILAETIPLTVALDLDRLAPEEAEALAMLFHTLKIGLNKQREILNLFSEIAAREDKTIMDIFSEPALKEILGAVDVDRGRKASAVRRYLRQRRYPHLSRAAEQMAQLLKILPLEPDMALTPPKDFEGMDYTIQLRFQNLDDFKKRCKQLKQLERHPVFADMFQL